ncbi:ABC transporter permease subunit [Spirochaetia bacterium 38H-sp]|uniref:ABC transporter permease subunit n=1 Tax=Rarispira pelagica TaxID=3141764 RepID=A0ABU9UBS1_9SPIR
MSIGASSDSYIEVITSIWLMLTGAKDLSTAAPGFTTGKIIAAGAVITLPLALIALFVLTFTAMFGASFINTAKYLAVRHGQYIYTKFANIFMGVVSFLAATPLFVGLWVLSNSSGNEIPLPIIAIVIVFLGGLEWDVITFLRHDMERHANTTYSEVFTTIGAPLGKFFPMPRTMSGYLFSSSLPSFLPYLAGKVPAIIGAVTIAEIIFSFPGLGTTLLDALLGSKTDLLVASVFFLLCVNAVVVFIVKTVLFLIYPRWYEKAI